MKSQFREKHLVLPIEKFLSCALSRNAKILQHLIIKFLLYCLPLVVVYMSCDCLERWLHTRGPKYSDLT